MKNKIATRAIAGALITLFIACNPKPEEPVVVVDKEQIKSEIQARENEFAQQYNSGEVKSIGYYADDAVTFFQNRKPIRTKQERLDFFMADLESNTNTIAFTTNEIFPSADGNVVLEIGSFVVSDSSKNVLNTGNYMSLFEKRNGKYVCLRDMSASDMEIK